MKIHKVCISCGAHFYVSEKDQKFFADNNLAEPKRCFFCRKKRRESRQKRLQASVYKAKSDS